MLSGMVFRSERLGDEARIRAVLESAFPGPGEADLVERLRVDGDAAISMVAADGSDIVGHLMLSRMRAPFPALGLAPVAVRPDRQRRGIGSRLVRAALAEAATGAWRAVFVLGDPAWYGGFGFDPRLAADFGSPYAGRHFMVLSLGGPLPMRCGAVDYPPAFQRLE